jgi:hypothetical protein
MKASPPVTAALKMRKMLKTSQRCHTCYRNTQHLVCKFPALSFCKCLSGRGCCSNWTRSTGTNAINLDEAPHINDGSSPLSVFLLYFGEIISLLVVETNRYYHNQLESLYATP